ncbi:DUF3892 domain-containing protein [Bradyrhizobium elkanii]|uniref:DUF3892 domain-containing protein n=1 Tax=Bradyrhizobium elkanii TaxID=29448 RepID=UPI00384D63D3
MSHSEACGWCGRDRRSFDRSRTGPIHSLRWSAVSARTLASLAAPNGKYVRTHADGYYNDNLLALPECP